MQEIKLKQYIIDILVYGQGLLALCFLLSLRYSYIYPQHTPNVTYMLTL